MARTVDINSYNFLVQRERNLDLGWKVIGFNGLRLKIFFIASIRWKKLIEYWFFLCLATDSFYKIVSQRIKNG